MTTKDSLILRNYGIVNQIWKKDKISSSSNFEQVPTNICGLKVLILYCVSATIDNWLYLIELAIEEKTEIIIQEDNRHHYGIILLCQPNPA